jgi:hypothetical protein
MYSFKGVHSWLISNCFHREPMISCLRSLFTRSILALLLGLLLSALPVSLQAENIYKWTDEEGRVRFSTTKPSASATPADLPTISRQDLDKRIENLRSKADSSCVRHGGIDCTAGPDTDGSVICANGFKGAILPYRFRCLEVRLEVTQLTILDEEQQIRSEFSIDQKAEEPSQITAATGNLHLALRNVSDVTATAVQVRFGEQGQGGKFEGPQEIEPYAIADYILPLSPQLKGKTLSYLIRCRNCRETLRRRKEP